METGLAFAGGGIPGTAGVGVLMALEEAGIKVTHVTGASSGAMVAALYAYGYKGEDLKKIVPRLTWRYLDFDLRAVLYRALFLRPRLEGFLKGRKLQDLMAELTRDDTLSSMLIPCGIVATDLNAGETVVFSGKKLEGYCCETELRIADAVRASFAIPVLFQPVHAGKRILVDGGVSSNCPVKVCRALGAKKVISVDPITPIAKADAGAMNSYEVLNKVINLTLKTQMEQEHESADFLLQPYAGKVGAFQFRKSQQCIDAGYKAVMENLDNIKASLNEK